MKLSTGLCSARNGGTDELCAMHDGTSVINCPGLIHAGTAGLCVGEADLCVSLKE